MLLQLFGDGFVVHEQVLSNVIITEWTISRKTFFQLGKAFFHQGRIHLAALRKLYLPCEMSSRDSVAMVLKSAFLSERFVIYCLMLQES